VREEEEEGGREGGTESVVMFVCVLVRGRGSLSLTSQKGRKDRHRNYKGNMHKNISLLRGILCLFIYFQYV
jgi:hypothetical protein